MKSSKAYIISLHALLSVVYIAFFSVQVFFNFDTSSNSLGAYKHYVSANHISHQQQSIKRSADPSSKKLSFRLNKRFQPASVPGIQAGITAPFPEYISLIGYRYYNAATLSAVFLCRSLRAPPSRA